MSFAEQPIIFDHIHNEYFDHFSGHFHGLQLKNVRRKQNSRREIPNLCRLPGQLLRRMPLFLVLLAGQIQLQERIRHHNIPPNNNRLFISHYNGNGSLQNQKFLVRCLRLHLLQLRRRTFRPCSDHIRQIIWCQRWNPSFQRRLLLHRYSLTFEHLLRQYAAWKHRLPRALLSLRKFQCGGAADSYVCVLVKADLNMKNKK